MHSLFLLASCQIRPELQGKDDKKSAAVAAAAAAQACEQEQGGMARGTGLGLALAKVHHLYYSPYLGPYLGPYLALISSPYLAPIYRTSQGNEQASRGHGLR